MERESIKNAHGERGTPALVADLMDHGVWDRQSAASFDIGANASASKNRHISFTPLVTSVDGVLAPEFTFFLKRIAKSLSAKWDRTDFARLCVGFGFLLPS